MTLKLLSETTRIPNMCNMSRRLRVPIRQRKISSCDSYIRWLYHIKYISDQMTHLSPTVRGVALDKSPRHKSRHMTCAGKLRQLTALTNANTSICRKSKIQIFMNAWVLTISPADNDSDICFDACTIFQPLSRYGVSACRSQSIQICMKTWILSKSDTPIAILKPVFRFKLSPEITLISTSEMRIASPYQTARPVDILSGLLIYCQGVGRSMKSAPDKWVAPNRWEDVRIFFGAMAILLSITKRVAD